MVLDAPATARIMGAGLPTRFYCYLKIQAAVGNPAHTAGQWTSPSARNGRTVGYVKQLRQCWLFYARQQVSGRFIVAHVFGERTMATLGRLMSLLSL